MVAKEMAMDFRFNKTKPSLQVNAGLKFYRTTADPDWFFLLPGDALLSTLVLFNTNGLFGTTRPSIPREFSNYMSITQPPLKGALIPSRRYVNPTVILLEEYDLKQIIVVNNGPPPVGTQVPFAVDNYSSIEYPVIFTKPDGKFDVIATMNNLESDILGDSNAKPPTVVKDLEIQQFKFGPSGQLILSLGNRFGINWEAASLSFLSLIAQQATPETIRESINKYILSMLVPLNVASTAVPTSTGPSKPIGDCNIIVGQAPMAQFICGQLNAGPQWDAIIKGQIKCTQKGFAIADSLIKVAATRIFAIPEQSIMEPIVNSLDAFNPARKVGKFGMGFFSLMYWIMRDPAAKLRIMSVYHLPGKPEPCGYGAEISNRNGELQVEVIKSANLSSYARNRFLVSVDFGKPIDTATLNKFIEQLNRLRYITSADIRVGSVSVNNEVLSTLSSQALAGLPRVNVQLSQKGFEVDDDASGVPIDLFYSSLIVPSISSKTISLSTRKDTGFVPNSRVESKSSNDPSRAYSSFRVLVGDIVIMDLKPEALFTISSVHILTLPLNTRVPVSRDDVILSSVPDEVQASFDQIFQSAIQQPLDRRDVGMLENGIKAFVNETASSQNITILNEFLASIPNRLVARGLIAVPPTTFYLDMMRQGLTESSAYVISNTVDLKRLEDYIAKVYDGRIDRNSFTNRQVILIPGNPSLKYNLANAGGTTSYLFVDQEWVSKTPNWPTRLASEYKVVMLYPAGTAYAASLSGSIITYLNGFKSARVRAAASAMAGQYQLALNFREPDDRKSTQTYLNYDITAMLFYFKLFYEPFMSEARLEQFLTSIATAVSKSEPKVASYGSNATIVATRLTRNYLTDPRPTRKGSSAQFPSLIYEWMVTSKTAPGLDGVLNPAFNIWQIMVSPYIGAKPFKDVINPRLAKVIREEQPLFEKATFYMVEIFNYSVELADRFSNLGSQRAVPFDAGYEFNLPLEVAAILLAETTFPVNEYIGAVVLELLKASRRAYQFMTAYLIFYALLVRIHEDGKLGPQQPHSRMLLNGLLETTKPGELAQVILSAVDGEFGPNPQYQLASAILYLFITTGARAAVSNAANFKSLFHDLYKPALDVYGWIEKRLKVSSLIKEVPQGIPASVPDCYNFTLSQMVSYVFQEELPPTTIQLFDRISKHQSRVDSKLQIIEIATNEGTSKDPIPGKLTETVQNALDAIRTANHPTVTIPNAQIGIVAAKVAGTNDLLLGISDPVGIPLQGLVALSVPFLSGKKPSEIVTGEIGSGFFNVYRDAIGVFIITTVNGETTEILDTPILDPNNSRIIDIQRCARVIKTGAPNGTAIFIQSRHTDQTFVPAAIEAITFARDTLGLISEANQVTLNREPISIDLVKIYENQFFEFHMGVKTFGSYIMTKGVPFAPLYKYFKAMGFFKNFDWLLDKLRTNVRLNVKSGVFTPVQTRTKIGLSDQNTNIMIISVLKALPFIILFRITNKLIQESDISDYIQYFDSTTEAKDVLPGTAGTSAWATNMNKLISNLNIDETSRNSVIAELGRVSHPFMSAPLSESKIVPNPGRAVAATNQMMDILLQNPLTTNLNHTLIASLGQSSATSSTHNDVPSIDNLLIEGARFWPDLGKMIRLLDQKIQDEMKYPVDLYPGSAIKGLVYRWLISKKKRPSNEKKRGGDETEEEEKTTVKDPRHLPFCQVWVNTYCRMAQKAIANYPKQLPVVIFDLVVMSNNSGSYRPMGDLLTLAYNYMETVMGGAPHYYLTEIMNIFAQPGDLAGKVLNLDINNPVWRQYFMPKGVIAHELEHFRQKSDHTKGDHDSVYMNLPYGGNKKRVFLVQHHDFMMSLVQAGLYEEVRKAWTQYLASGKI